MSVECTLIGTLSGPEFKFEGDLPEWTDVLRWRVTGAGTAYDAIVGLNAADNGYGADHPIIPGISGAGVKMERSTDEGYILQVTHRRPPGGIWPTLDNLPIRMAVSFSLLQIPADVDALGNVVVGSAGDPLDPPQTTDQLLVRVRLMKWMTSYNVTDGEAMIGRVNTAAINLPNSLGPLPARTLKCLNFAPMVELYVQPGMTEFYSTLMPILFEFEYKTDSFDRKIIDKGFQAWYTDTASVNHRDKLVTAMGLQPIAQAILLNGQGAPLLPTGYTIRNAGTHGFSAFVNVGASVSKLPSYITPVQKSSGSAFYLPYQIDPQADFTPFIIAGL